MLGAPGDQSWDGAAPMGHNTSSALVAAAEALALELARFDENLAGFKRLALTSKKNLNRATGMLNDLAEIEAQIGVHIQALVQAIGATGDAQLSRVSEVKARAEQLQARAVAFNTLTAQLEELGAGASALNDKLQGPSPTVVDVVEELGLLSTRAIALHTQAKTEGFDDVAHLADALKQQLQALKGKLGRHA